VRAIPPADPPRSVSGLRQRVPGAQLVSADAAPPQPAPPSEEVAALDAVAARSLVEEFESGVNRAQAAPGGPASVARRVPPATAPARQAPPNRAAPPDRPAGSSALKRRVPGATLDSDSLPPRRSPAEIDAPSSATPDEVRHLVQQFELGVTRARTNTRPVHQNRERTEQ
jgi:hypothetical protein